MLSWKLEATQSRYNGRVHKFSTFDNCSLTGVIANNNRLPAVNESSHDAVQ